MRQQRMFLLLGIIAAVLVLGVAYAAISSVDLEVSGNAIATPDQGNFKVAFTGNPVISGKGTAEAKITGLTTAYLNVRELVAVGDTLYADFTVANTSDDIVAYISSKVTNSNTTYFDVTHTLSTSVLPAKTGTATLRVTVKLIQTPVQADIRGDIGITVTASPEQRGASTGGDSNENQGPITFAIDGQNYEVESGTTLAQFIGNGREINGSTYTVSSDGYVKAPSDYYIICRKVSIDHADSCVMPSNVTRYVKSKGNLELTNGMKLVTTHELANANNIVNSTSDSSLKCDRCQESLVWE